MNETETGSRLRPAMGFKDLWLFFVTTGISIQWITRAAAGGSSSITVWVIGCLAFYLPLVVCVLELWSRYPQEGGLYQWSHRAFGDGATAPSAMEPPRLRRWSHRAFGDFAGFMTGWFYWACRWFADLKKRRKEVWLSYL